MVKLLNKPRKVYMNRTQLDKVREDMLANLEEIEALEAYLNDAAERGDHRRCAMYAHGISRLYKHVGHEFDILAYNQMGPDVL